MFSYNDDPTATDCFENDAFLDEICKLIRNCQPPKGIGINGYWGTGKTSTLVQIYHKLTGEHPFANGVSAGTQDKSAFPILAVWFEAWRHQHEALPIVALLHEIRARMSYRAKFCAGAKKLSEVSIRGSLSILDAVIKVASQGAINPKLSELQLIGESYEQKQHQHLSTGQTIRKLLQEAIQTVLPKDKKDKKEKQDGKLVIFIDDLDRCQPEAALRFMEGIKIYLNLNNCVVLFGMDQRQVEHALAKALILPPEYLEHHAREYLEKICQDIIHLPLPDKEKKSNYLKGLLVAKGAGLDQEKINAIISITDCYDCLPACQSS